MKGKTIGGILATVLVLGGIGSIGNNDSTDNTAPTPVPSVTISAHTPKPTPTVIPAPSYTPAAIPTSSPDVDPTPVSASEPAPVEAYVENEIEYIGNRNSKKFHRQSCRSLPKEKNRVYISGRDNAVSMGYSPCANCDP